MKELGEALFRAVCLSFSALLLILSLLYGIRLAAVNDTAAARKREAEQLKTENQRLRAACESSLSLEEIERYATEKLGMQALSGDQIIRVEEPIE